MQVLSWRATNTFISLYTPAVSNETLFAGEGASADKGQTCM